MTPFPGSPRGERLSICSFSRGGKPAPLRRGPGSGYKIKTINPYFLLILYRLKYIMARSKEEKYMQAALDEAAKAFEKQEVPVGAVIVCNDLIIARAHNLTETLNDPTAHAEMQAITAATNWLGGKYLTDCTIYVTLEPCAMCAGALGWSQVSELVYGADDDKKGFTLVKGHLLHPKTKVASGILEQECRELMVRFFKTKR
jgi:tRNA(adenine34) deaminase